ncbi:hypothetical protein B5X24_HaOG206938 [Helicoverpa armigera]|nr:hypothetical protein B5X24_HaOG206938 [Helicoverpa armigera]
MDDRWCVQPSGQSIGASWRLKWAEHRCKLAAEGDRGGGLLIPAREPDDSGIDSDDAVRRLILAHQRLPFSDESSSDDELQIPSPTTNRHRNERRASLKTEEDHDLVIMQWPQDQFTKDQSVTRETSPDRSSPPLYEVELTASDEDDDASVLELVIPMHSSRYQRVPTSSPKKSKPKVVKRYFCSMICCGRKSQKSSKCQAWILCVFYQRLTK